MEHTILGAGGSIGIPLALELLKSGERVQLVSRSGYAMQGAESLKADLVSYEETLESVKDSDVVYLVAGLPYDAAIWNEMWPKIMKNVVEACKKVQARLVFFDNVYMYGQVTGPMTEQTPYRPCSRKGEIRARIALYLEDEMRKGNVNALIARAGDLYGPYATRTSMPYLMAFLKLREGKSAQWMVHTSRKHSFTYTLDCAKAMSLLSKGADCGGQVWHLPTFNPAPDGKTFIRMIADELQVAPDILVMKKWMIRMAGLFNRTIAEVYEMLYQYEFDYYFDSTKFNEYFNFKPTPYDKGIHDTITYLDSMAN